MKEGPEDEEVEERPQDAKQVDEPEALEELPPGEVVAVFEHDERQQDQHDGISDDALWSTLVLGVEIGKDGGEHASEEADDDGNGGLLEEVELGVERVTRLWTKNMVMMK